MPSLTAFRLDARDPDWAAQARSLFSALGTRNLLPPQFLFATLREIGGDILQWRRGTRLLAVGIRLTALNAVRSRQHLICCHLTPAGQAAGLMPADLQPACARLFPDAPIQIYDGAGRHVWDRPAVRETVDGIAYGPPSVTDAHAVRRLQAAVWQAADTFLYPPYLHDPAFGAAYSLVARRQDRVVGFLLGFLHDGAAGLLPPLLATAPGTLHLESVIMGIHPDYRRRDIAFHLKRVQAAQTRAMGMDHMQWVVDPLQYRNARLNLGRLGAFSGQFLRDYLPFRNALNQVRASRLRLVWSLRTPSVLQGVPRPSLSLATLPHIGVINEGLDLARRDGSRDWLAMEIPPNWEHLQSADLPLAQRWRDTTDAILDRYVGPGPDRYLITHTGYRDDKVYLVLERARPETVARYVAVPAD